MADLDALVARWRGRFGDRDRLIGADARRRLERFRFTDDAAYFKHLIERANATGQATHEDTGR